MFNSIIGSLNELLFSYVNGQVTVLKAFNFYGNRLPCPNALLHVVNKFMKALNLQWSHFKANLII